MTSEKLSGHYYLVGRNELINRPSFSPYRSLRGPTQLGLWGSPAGIGMKPRADGTLGRVFGFLAYYWLSKTRCRMSVQTPEPESLELPPAAEKRLPSAVTVLLTVLVLSRH
jgi:hypothetical protein